LAPYITPLTASNSLSAQLPLIEALDKMILGKVDQLLVLEEGEGECVGWITRSMITRVQDALRHPGPDGKAPAAVTQPIWQN
ncbi:MAG: hypothetical protein Q8S75_13440, partial [Nitrospirota bacterium]|nr:hypothetical protein [Nitrospirota bacterium]